jgi:hypothetical protein
MNKFNSFSTDEVAILAQLLAEDFAGITSSIDESKSYNALLYNNAFIVRGLIDELESEIVDRKRDAANNLRSLGHDIDDIDW